MVKKVLFLCALTIAISAFAMEGKEMFPPNIGDTGEKFSSKLREMPPQIMNEDIWRESRRDKKKDYKKYLNECDTYGDYLDVVCGETRKWIELNKDVLPPSLQEVRTRGQVIYEEDRSPTFDYCGRVNPNYIYEGDLKCYIAAVSDFIKNYNENLEKGESLGSSCKKEKNRDS